MGIEHALLLTSPSTCTYLTAEYDSLPFGSNRLDAIVCVMFDGYK